jgi:hypothetical protein
LCTQIYFEGQTGYCNNQEEKRWKRERKALTKDRLVM